MVDFTPLLSKEKLLEQIRDAQREFGISSSEIGRGIGLSQSTMSNLLSPNSRNPRELSYTDAYDIIQFISTRVSLIRPRLSVSDIMTDSSGLEWAEDDQTLNEVSELMFTKGYSQMPVRGKKTLHFKGVVTDLSILRRLMRGGEGNSSIDELGKLRLIEAGVVENVLKCPLDTSLREAANILLGYPAVLITSKEDQIIGILTRSDLLKLFNKRRMKLP
ncbi:MAG: CBS domain-containing protein [Candidatus Bathyarchaeia archaeon]|jgi:predicted transcriptional regulator